VSDNTPKEENIYLYNSFAKEFKVNQNIKIKELKDKQKENLKKKIKEYIRTQFEQKKLKTFCFILIKHNDNVINLEKKVLKKEKDSFLNHIKKFFNFKSSINLLENRIDKNFDNISNDSLDNISIKVYLIENKKENKYLFNKLKKELCSLEEKLNPYDYEKSFSNYIFENKLYIFSFGAIALTMTLIYRLSQLGILLNYISIDTITLITNIIVFFMLITIGSMFLITFLYLLLILFLDNLFSKMNCSYSRFNILNTFKESFTPFLTLYVILITTIILYDLFSNHKNSIITNILIKDYITQTREPSLREIHYKGVDKKILLIGKDTKFISFLYVDDIKDDIGNKIQKQICTNDELKESYLDSLITLLYIKQNKKDTKNNNEKESKLNYIANRRYRVLKISDITLNEKTPIFKNVFCDVNNKEKKANDTKK